MTVFPDYIFIDDSSITFDIVENIMREDMSNGMAKTKLIQSVGVVNYRFNVSININKLSSFRNWMRGELLYGRLFFLLRDPIDGVLKKHRFLDTNISWAKQGKILVSNFTLEAYDE